MPKNFTELAFTDSVRAVQEEYGSRASYARMEPVPRRTRLTAEEAEFIAGRDSFYLATVGEDGWPYVQFRGGPPGFLRVLDPQTVAFADFRGNRQYISAGNLRATGKAALILVDYPGRNRLKVWAETETVEAAAVPDLAARLEVPGYDAVVERAVVFRVQAFDWNCPQHITPRFTLEEIEAGLHRPAAVPA